MSSRASKLRVVKTISPGQPGAVKLAERYGDALVAVRYRQDAGGTTRYTTVELTVDVLRIAEKPNRVVRVKIGAFEQTLRIKALSAGAKWDEREKVWRMPLAVARQLGLVEQVVDVASCVVKCTHP